MFLALASHVAARQTAELRVHDRRQFVEGAAVSVAPGTEQLGHVISAVGLHRAFHRGRRHLTGRWVEMLDDVLTHRRRTRLERAHDHPDGLVAVTRPRYG